MASNIVLTEEKFESAWNEFEENLKIAKIDSFFDKDSLKEDLKNATAAMSIDSGCCYNGSLIVHINLLTKLAKRLAKMVSLSLPIDEKSLLKVCLTQHLSKIKIFIPNTNTWEINNRGLLFKFNDLPGKLKFGERSLLICSNLGITYTAEEWEAMRVLDNLDEFQYYNSSHLSLIIKQANELAYTLEKTQIKNGN